VECACLLPKAAARHHNDACSVQQLAAVQPVSWLA
jgi:hypothetical protein